MASATLLTTCSLMRSLAQLIKMQRNAAQWPMTFDSDVVQVITIMTPDWGVLRASYSILPSSVSLSRDGDAFYSMGAFHTLSVN